MPQNDTAKSPEFPVEVARVVQPHRSREPRRELCVWQLLAGMPKRLERFELVLLLANATQHQKTEKSWMRLIVVLDVLNLFFWDCLNFKLHVVHGCFASKRFEVQKQAASFIRRSRAAQRWRRDVRVRWSLVTLPTFWSLVTLPTSLGRVASDLLVFFLWPCSLKNTSHRILFLVVACDPTYLFGRVASDHFLALAIPKHLPWPDLHSDRIWPYSPTCHRKHGFCVEVQQFRCLWDVLPWPYTCWLGSVKWLLCGRCNNFDGSEMISPDPIHACWEGSQVIDSDFVWPAQYFQCLREVLCDPMFGDTGDPTCYLCGRWQNSRWLREVPCVYVLLVWQVQYFRHLREGHRDTARSSPWH